MRPTLDLTIKYTIKALIQWSTLKSMETFEFSILLLPLF